jgi:ribonuclease PH
MLPRSCSTRIERDITKGKLNGRSHEIQRLIGRSLRAVIDLKAVGERTVWIDCDVLQGDGGTRCAAITGSYVALAQAFHKLVASKTIPKSPLVNQVAAISVGIVAGKPALDLCYKEDAGAEVDMNVVMTASGHFIEIQGTAEGNPFAEADLKKLLSLAKLGIRRLLAEQNKALKR